MPLLSVKNLTVDLPTPSGWVRPVADVSFSLDAGATLGLVGESGSGKTMLALSLLGLLPAGARRSGQAFFECSAGLQPGTVGQASSLSTSGGRSEMDPARPERSRGERSRGSSDIKNDGAQHAVCVPMASIGTPSSLPKAADPPPREARASSADFRFSNFDFRAANNALDLITLPEDHLRQLRGSVLAMIFQEPMTALNPVLRIGAQIEEAIAVHFPQLSRDEIRRRALDSLEQAAVPDPAVRAAQFPHQLSGGLRQRALIAMALSCGPRLLIADEPTTALDVTIQKQILDLLKNLRARLGLAMLFITHDLAVVSQIAERTAVMYAGRIVEEGPTAEILRRPRHPYTEGLLRAAPSLEKKTLQPVPGSVPQLNALPPGCAFEPRCPYRLPECSLAVPELRDASPSHRARCVLV